MNEFIPSGVVTAIALILYYITSSKKPIYEERCLRINEVTEWRNRLGVTVENACELLGVSKDTLIGLESGKYDITKRTKLALLACELAYIAADQYIDAHPKKFPNSTIRGYYIANARKKIVSGVIEQGKNGYDFPLTITLEPNSLIHYFK